MKIEVKGIRSALEQVKRTIDLEISNIANITQKEAKTFTPKKTGRAREGWNKMVNPSGFRVENRVPYIGRLEAGASKQAPKGIIGPTITSVKRKLNK